MIIGRDANVSRSYVERALEMSQAVGRVVLRRGAGGGLQPTVFSTGFLISNLLMMTCHHVIGSLSEAADAQIVFDYYERSDGSFAQPVRLPLASDLFFATNTELDVSVIALGADVGKRTFIKLLDSVGDFLIGDTLSMIHHPRGEPQRMSLRSGQVVAITQDFVHYDVDTSPGSAGAPVFNDAWDVIGIHHARVPRVNPEGQLVARDGRVLRSSSTESVDWIANEGVRASSIR